MAVYFKSECGGYTRISAKVKGGGGGVRSSLARRMAQRQGCTAKPTAISLGDRAGLRDFLL